MNYTNSIKLIGFTFALSSLLTAKEVQNHKMTLKDVTTAANKTFVKKVSFQFNPLIKKFLAGTGVVAGLIIGYKAESKRRSNLKKKEVESELKNIPGSESQKRLELENEEQANFQELNNLKNNSIDTLEFENRLKLEKEEQAKFLEIVDRIKIEKEEQGAFEELEKLCWNEHINQCTKDLNIASGESIARSIIEQEEKVQRSSFESQRKNAQEEILVKQIEVLQNKAQGSLVTTLENLKSNPKMAGTTINICNTSNRTLFIQEKRFAAKTLINVMVEKRSYSADDLKTTLDFFDGYFSLIKSNTNGQLSEVKYTIEDCAAQLRNPIAKNSTILTYEDRVAALGDKKKDPFIPFFAEKTSILNEEKYFKAKEINELITSNNELTKQIGINLGKMAIILQAIRL